MFKHLFGLFQKKGSKRPVNRLEQLKNRLDKDSCLDGSGAPEGDDLLSRQRDQIEMDKFRGIHIPSGKQSKFNGGRSQVVESNQEILRNLKANLYKR